MANEATPESFESTAGQVAAELARRGIAPGQRVMVTIEPDDWLARVRALARPRLDAEGVSDVAIDRLIEDEREAVQPRLG
jgi:RNA 3'-terminal phosphate cyclase